MGCYPVDSEDSLEMSSAILGILLTKEYCKQVKDQQFFDFGLDCSGFESRQIAAAGPAEDHGR
ncbi:MAG: hypothetical protein C3F13_06555 [Anaerolineales bacterium]|nr:MAG: hypothetical protein C3F13_06555 [Anaerolineales bacterium]